MYPKRPRQFGVLIIVVVSAVVAGGALATGAVAQETTDGGFDPGDTRANATTIHDGETIAVDSNSTEHAVEWDWFEFDATSGESYTLTAELDRDTPLYNNIAVTVFDEDGEEVAVLTAGDFPMTTEVASGDYLARAADIAETNGTYYVRVDEGEYNLTLQTETLNQYDPNEDPGNATQVEGNATVEAVGALYDGDYYAVNLTAGDEFDATLSDAYKENDWIRTFYVIAPDGDRLLPGLDGIDFEAQQNGTYVVSANFEAAGNSDLVATSEYTLDLQRTPDELDAPDDGAETPGNDTDAPDDGTDDCDL